ncbi:MAG TPA: pyridoxamine 5'-phosphate oxidase family protein, partial [Anaerolineales bacterium]|nr:pyridoxamine 5'-phosphate oxidase family protein [Anaerolineales bacterium]
MTSRRAARSASRVPPDPSVSPPSPSGAAIKRLAREANVWFVSVGEGGAPHMAPVWFVFEGGWIYVCTDPRSVKVRNLRARPQVAAALEGGDRPVIVHGKAEILTKPWPENAVRAFRKKYD